MLTCHFKGLDLVGHDKFSCKATKSMIICVGVWKCVQSAGCPPAACSVLLSVCESMACCPVTCEIASFVTNYTIDPPVNLPPRLTHIHFNLTEGGLWPEWVGGPDWPLLPLCIYQIVTYVHTHTWCMRLRDIVMVSFVLYDCTASMATAAL